VTAPAEDNASPEAKPFTLSPRQQEIVDRARRQREATAPTSQEPAPGLPISVSVPIPPPARVWSPAEWTRIQTGFRARDMEDRWNAVVRETRLSLYRSWTGFGIFEAQFAPTGGGWRIVEALVESESSIYRRASDAEESDNLADIIDNVLLASRNDGAPPAAAELP
jgi:hypothetical protein